MSDLEPEAIFQSSERLVNISPSQNFETETCALSDHNENIKDVDLIIEKNQNDASGRSIVRKATILILIVMIAVMWFRIQNEIT